ncbi:sigma-54 dependent transcriptional regulator [Parasegetibacter sp. NRK P23]|uniref:sigma-54-dependent transcriptional regulator n=1 Tax=Parasegetibacter sp. NRK P23 TaxID=2942999 RepID=UPI00204412A2|nr:sigma-54 dependent transcriptional regulator [Parasegetibacter sp. NRK P23]MCM5530495.1 sigma-54 dependent transcriptional regulator [Parasegetibacter sp. NRK P23]
MKKKILIVEDQFIEANNLQMILERADYFVCGIARSVPEALEMVENNRPDMVLLDIFLRGNLTGIDLARKLNEKNIGFVFLSANSNQKTLDEAKVTGPYGFLVKPFREKDILVMLDIAWYRHEQNFAASPGNKAVVSGPDTIDVPAFQHIIGNSGTLKKLLGTVLMVAPSDASVLILGESGTGKERIAAAIHALSPKKGRPFVKVNCAALPATLIESELFGHERGAFTGAFEKRIGKFEQANGGTIFLDEIGEMPPETQVKLLRVLQEKEIERVGGSKTLKMDVRVIAATNRDLQKEIAEGRFRMDLYYRLNVFPLTLPPLRERKEDIPVLADYFMRRYAKECGKNIKNIAPPAMEKLLRYEWPGNIRELENQVERAVLMTNEPFITDFDLPVTQTPEKPTQARDAVRPKTIDENERDHIISVLRSCNGKISGEGGAAEILQINVSTLNSRIKKHGIKKEHYFSVEKK